MKTYNGYRSWNAWNVSLWINNDELIYQFACHLASSYGLHYATCVFMQTFKKTPDGAIYNKKSVFDTLKELKNDLKY
jgi:hypothetical protein